MKSKITFMLMAIAMMLGLQGCPPDPIPVISINDFDFKATNLTVDEGKLSAKGGTPVTSHWTVTVTINGDTTTVSGTSKSNELPVRAGDEIEISFNQSCPEQTEATFSLPDGSSQKVTVSSPSFKWTVPANFTPGMQIKGVSRYETDDTIYESTGEITLISLLQ